MGIPTAELAYYSKHGQRIWSEPRGIAAGYRWPQFSIHRGQLLGVLHRAVLQRLGPERVHPGHHLSRFGQGADRVWADSVDRASGAPRSHVEADVLVGCDGIHSVMRQALFPHEGPPQWNGITMWRAVTEGTPFLSGRTMVMAGQSARADGHLFHLAAARGGGQGAHQLGGRVQERSRAADAAHPMYPIGLERRLRQAIDVRIVYLQVRSGHMGNS